MKRNLQDQHIIKSTITRSKPNLSYVIGQLSSCYLENMLPNREFPLQSSVSVFLCILSFKNIHKKQAATNMKIINVHPRMLAVIGFEAEVLKLKKIWCKKTNCTGTHMIIIGIEWYRSFTNLNHGYRSTYGKLLHL